MVRRFLILAPGDDGRSSALERPFMAKEQGVNLVPLEYLHSLEDMHKDTETEARPPTPRKQRCLSAKSAFASFLRHLLRGRNPLLLGHGIPETERAASHVAALTNVHFPLLELCTVPR